MTDASTRPTQAELDRTAVLGAADDPFVTFDAPPSATSGSAADVAPESTAPSAEPVASAEPDAATTVAPAAVKQPRATDSPDRRAWSRSLRFQIVVLVAIGALFLAFVLLVAFGPTGAAVTALAVIAAPIATIVAVYYGISLALRQVREARDAAVAAEARARAAESSARESDAWAAQMESGLRVAVAKLRAARVETVDVERAAGTPDEFF